MLVKNWKNADLLQSIYPIGVCIEFSKDIDPNNIFIQMKWVRHGNGKVTVGVDENDTLFNTVGKIGGEKAHTLTNSEMPSHLHGFVGGNTFTWGRNVGYDTVRINNAIAEAANPINNCLVTAQQNWTRTINEGGSQSHNNLQPYITTYKWTRVE